MTHFGVLETLRELRMTVRVHSLGSDELRMRSNEVSDRVK